MLSTRAVIWHMLKMLIPHHIHRLHPFWWKRHRPYRGSDVERWIRSHRDSLSDPRTHPDMAPGDRSVYYALDDMLDEYRLRADLGTSLERPAETLMYDDGE